MEQDSCSLRIEMYWLIFILLCVAVTGFLVWASAYIGSGVYLKSFCRGKKTAKHVALTFDDSPSQMTCAVLDVLKEHDVKASFFVIGSKIEGNEDILQRIAEEGHIIGNHSWSHTPGFPLKKYKDVVEEIRMTSDRIQETTGKTPVLFRPPFGVTNPHIGKAVRELGMSSIGWSIRSLDTLENRTRENIMARIASQMEPGSVILLHDRCKDSDRLLRMLLQYLEENDYTIVTIEEMFNLKIYD